MNYPYSAAPYFQATMAQAMQAIMTGSPLPSNCIVVAVPMEQAKQMFPQLMTNYASGGNAMVFSRPSSYYGQLYQPQIGPYSNNQQSNALVPYSNYNSPGYNQNYNYPVVPYVDYNHQSKKTNHHGKKYHSEPHSNVYNSSSFDTHMDNLSWSRLFGRHHHHHHYHHSKQQRQDQGAISYEQKASSSKQQPQHQVPPLDSVTLSSLSSTSSSSTTSDESIRRVNVSTKQPAILSSSKQQQIKGSLPFKYSSDFVPDNGKQQSQQSQKSNKQNTKVRADDVFYVKTVQPSQPTSKK
ncbi:unnamed protein product [Rotaria sp. Silwood1]|nr:unnamed protein product [Rotaria sp. Silwood1]CAF3364857.1 unnamed protein product [Rotaria sp. Silwood1]CAF3379698.1 unnamed protein product [Rotaria sp. Silwood1]CAF4581673.1 unnamed protein product [Rotaria sp. Silwood1]